MNHVSLVLALAQLEHLIYHDSHAADKLLVFLKAVLHLCCLLSSPLQRLQLLAQNLLFLELLV